MSGKPRTTTPLTRLPFDLDRVAGGETLILVELVDGRLTAARLADADYMYLPGDPVPVQQTAKANAARGRDYVNAMAMVLDMDEQGRPVREIIAALIERGFLYDGGERDHQRGSVKRWRREVESCLGRGYAS